MSVLIILTKYRNNHKCRIGPQVLGQVTSMLYPLSYLHEYHKVLPFLKLEKKQFKILLFLATKGPTTVPRGWGVGVQF